MDQITLDILWNRLVATVNEQAAALMRSSFTSIVRESGDLSAGVFDRRGRMVAQAVTGTPGHINSMATGMIHFLDRFPVDTLRPGDVLVTNDPWKTASQLNDITVATPVFRGGRLVALFANTCHALDIGGRGLSADARSVFEEGLAIPMMKLHDAGRPVEPLYEMIAANVRTPEEVLGDLHSQVVGNEVGARQLGRFLGEFGLDDIETLADEIVGRSERAMRERIAALPDGEYRYGLTIDGFEQPIEIRAAVRIHGDELTVDFAGSSGPVPLGVNVALNYTRAYTTYGIKCAISPDVPNNEGSFRPVHVTAPEGSILNARFPAAVAGRHLVGHFLPSAVMGALAQALPDRVMAPGFDGLWDTQITGVERGTRRHFSFTWFSAGGTGALRGQDGLSATAYPSGVAGVAAEVIETLAPVVLRRRELRSDSGGAGTFRGGLGQTMEIEVRTDEPYIFSGLYERTRHAAPGLQGGRPGACGRIETANAVTLPPKISTVVPADTVVTVELPGGGGYGPPAARDPARVLEDVREGYVSLEQAREQYGVAIDRDSGTVLADETRGLRTEMRPPEGVRSAPAAGGWLGEPTGRRPSDQLRQREGGWVSEGMNTTILALYEYGVWANERLLDKLRGVDHADLTRRLSRGAQPILPALVHLYGADFRWLHRWRRQPPPEVVPADFPTVEAVEERWRAMWPERRAYLAGLDQAALEEEIEFTRPAGTVWIVRWQAIVHCANHATQHRSELAMMLSDLGRSPGDMDMFLWAVRPR